jgi:hypothetical protein
MAACWALDPAARPTAAAAATALAALAGSLAGGADESAETSGRSVSGGALRCGSEAASERATALGMQAGVSSSDGAGRQHGAGERDRAGEPATGNGGELGPGAEGAHSGSEEDVREGGGAAEPTMARARAAQGAAPERSAGAASAATGGAWPAAPWADMPASAYRPVVRAAARDPARGSRHSHGARALGAGVARVFDVLARRHTGSGRTQTL